LNYKCICDGNRLKELTQVVHGSDYVIFQDIVIYIITRVKYMSTALKKPWKVQVRVSVFQRIHY